VAAAKEAIKDGAHRRAARRPEPRLGAEEARIAVLRGDVVKTGKRIDGRALDQVRPIVSEPGILPRTHGSALFTRGETQAWW
jgi:polyribonucleotide nucleotidyltransferase